MNKIAVVFGSESDKEVYSKIIGILKKNKISCDFHVASAHRTPDRVELIVQENHSIIIAGAGLAAHLPGVIASKTIKPVIGVPCEGNYQGLDALLSIAQMPPGIPVLAVGVSNAEMAALNAIKMLKKYTQVNLIGDKEEKAAAKAIDLLKKFDVDYQFSSAINKDKLNIVFTEFDEPVEKSEELVIYVPLLLKKDDKAEAALNLLKHTDHGLWVGINRGENAAIAAIEIMNIDGEYNLQLEEYRKELRKK